MALNEGLLYGLWLFKADQETTTFETWKVDWVANMYEPPTDFSLAGVQSWIDVPANCQDPANSINEEWDNLHNLITDYLIEQDKYVEFTRLLAECDDTADMTM